MKHTKGPWFNTTDGEANFYGIATQENWLFRIQQNGEKGTAEQEANAKLLAAAPDMLEALKDAHRELDILLAEKIAKEEDFMPSKSSHWPTVVKVHEAIKKATDEWTYTK